MSQDAAGNVYVTGYIRNVSSGDDYLTVKYNSGGSQEWVSTYNNDAVNGGRHVAINLLFDFASR